MATAAPKAVRIAGREPAAWIGLIEGVLLVLMAFGLGIGQDVFGPIMAVVTAAGGLYTAWATKDTMLGVILTFVKSVLTLVAVYGVSLNDQQTAAIIGLTSVVVGFWQRTQTSPVYAPVDPSPVQVTPSPLPPEGEGEVRAYAPGANPC